MTTTYLFGKANRTNVASMQRQAVNIIKSFFVSSNLQPSGTKGQYDPPFPSKMGIVGKPMFSVTPDKVIVQLFYYIGAQDNVSDTTVAALGDALTRCWGRTVELRLIRLNHTILDSSIFAQYLAENSNKYSFNRILDMIKTSMPKLKAGASTESAVEGTLMPTSDITGVKIKLSGRLTTQRSGPRQTVQSDRLGSSGKGVNGTLDNSQYTSKNKLGAFTIKVWVSGSF